MPGSLLVAARQKTLVNAQSPRRSLQTSRNLGLIHTSQYKSKPSEELQRIFLTSSGGQSTSYLSISSANSSHLRLAPASTEARSFFTRSLLLRHFYSLKYSLSKSMD